MQIALTINAKNAFLHSLNKYWKKAFALSLCILFTLVASAQNHISGIVIDSLSQKPIAKANIMLLKDGKVVTFCRSNDKGEFSLSHSISNLKDLQLQATALEYKKKRIAISTPTNNRIEMVQQIFEMQEVTVKAGPITSVKDTITFDLTRFTSERDNSLKDVLAKLPGVNVDNSGKISVNGKDISRFTVEGLDLSDGKYNKLTENIKAKDVKKAEVIEHDQPIKALRNKVFSDNIAMNVTLKDEARDRLSVTLRPYISVGKPTHIAGSANILQVGKRKQIMYDAIYDRRGRDVAQSGITFVYDFMAPQPVSLSSWYSVPTLRAPIEAERLRFNTSQSYSINRLTKTKNDKELRITADYYRNVLRQNTSNSSTYYFAKIPTTTTEKQQMMLKEDIFNFSIDKKINTEKHYGSIRFSVNAEQDDALSGLESTGHTNISQRVRTPKVNVKGYITSSQNNEHGTLSLQSIVDYHYSRNDLYINADQEKINSNLWHNNNEVSWRTSKNGFTQNYNFSIDLQHLNVHNGHTQIAFHSSPSLNYEKGKWRATVRPELDLEYLTQQRKWYFQMSPSIYANYNKSSRTETNALFYYAQSIRGLSDFALDSYRINYRTWQTSPTFMPRTQSLNFNLNHSYKRVVKEFFSNFSLNANRTWSNSVVDMQIQNGNYLMTYIQHNTKSTNLTGRCWLSKGFYKQHFKTSCSISATYSNGEQYTAGNILRYQYRSLTFSPTLTYSPSWAFVTYNGDFALSKSTFNNASISSRFNWKQSLTLTSTIQKVDLSLSGIYYHNQLEGATLNTFIADAKVTWRQKKFLVLATLANLFNKRNYIETSYSGVGIFTNSYELRPRELILTFEFRL
ncbi:MAG: hypothetical protein HXN79_03300 [Prevotella pallens]|uniref:carboxypeptidase-like regulatory domain-containing protein n=1 Tax=Prevotella pallens TaxID=60133 RepID=UPI001CABF1B4|nr:carboxypeptidase-like regulatory domain-containing protein [Prevotella pallens]MBF1487335.1 hypothetical protein [Prevotella pallens]